MIAKSQRMTGPTAKRQTLGASRPARIALCPTGSLLHRNTETPFRSQTPDTKPETQMDTDPHPFPTDTSCSPLPAADSPDPIPAPEAKPNPLITRLRAHRKPKGGLPSEMTKLEILWDGLSEEDKDYWREQFLSEQTVPQIRQLILDKLNINLRFDIQFRRFRAFVNERDQIAAELERVATEANVIHDVHPGWTVDQVRDEVLKRAYERVLCRGDLNQGLNIVRVHTCLKRYLLDQEKHEFNAVDVCRKQLPELKEIEDDDTMTESEKTQAFMEKIFGHPPVKKIAS